MNFSNSQIWINSLYLRYPVDKIVNLGQLHFYNDNNLLICQNFFEPTIDKEELQELGKKIREGNKIKFNYFNNSKNLAKLNSFAKEKKFTYEIIDSWEAPRLLLKKNLANYLLTECGKQIKRNYKFYQKNKESYKFYNSHNNDILKLWRYALKIDYNSWKKDENSDMKSLHREDLQYLPFLLLEKDKSNLVVVCDNEDNPLAYSLMFKGDNDYWYAVKWGASYQGRKKYAGFYALFNHLEYIIAIDKQLKIDFWGRRNKTYDGLRNDFVIRNHVVVYKKEN